MYELSCPSCNTSSNYNLSDKVLTCQFCSTSFKLNLETGHKEFMNDHFIIANTSDTKKMREIIMEWLKRMHHKPNEAEKEFYILDLKGISIPYWVVSFEVHTVWKGLVKKRDGIVANVLDHRPGSNYLIESGNFRRNYRWAVSARNNLCEYWGLTRLHEPAESVEVEWDGFPLDSTFSRGIIEEPSNIKSTYEARESFDFRYANGLPILGVQVDEEEALRRACHHAELYHYKLASSNIDYLIDHRTEVEVAGVQLIHLPFWNASYLYRPKGFLKYFLKSNPKNLLISGYAKGILKSEVALVKQDKFWINSVICLVAFALSLLLGFFFHPVFFAISLFFGVVSVFSGYLALKRKEMDKQDRLIVLGEGLSA